MADTAVAVTAGAGTNIDTRTEATNGNHRQVIVIGDPDLNAGVAPVDATNGLSVSVTNASLTVAAHAVTNAGTFVTQENGAALTALQLLDDTVVADDAAFTPATTKVVMSGFEFDDTAPDLVDEGDAGAARMSANRNIYVQIRDAAGNERGMNVDASGRIITVLQSSALTALELIDNIVLAEDTAHVSGDAGVQMLAVRSDTPTAKGGTDGDYTPVLTDSAGRLHTKTVMTTSAGTIVDPVAAIGGGVPVVNSSGEYETVAASQTAQTIGATGGTGDYISGILVVPATTSPGNVLLLDNATSITVFAGGASSVSNLVPFFIPLGMISVSGAWKVTTGANVSCIATGNFT